MNGLLSLIARLPLSVLRAFAWLVAQLICCAPNTGMRWVVRTNFALIAPSLSAPERAKLERQNILNQCYTAVESIKIWGSSPAYSLGLIRNVTGLMHLTHAFAQGNGVILVVPHLGTWEVMNAWLNQFGAPVIMYKPARHAGVNQFMLQARQRLQSTLVPTDESGVRAVFKALKQGGFTAILPDHVPDSSSGGVYSSFFDHAVMTTTLISKLAQKTRCAVIGLCAIRSADGSGFDIACSVLPDTIYDPVLQTSVDALNQHMMRMIAPHLTDYVWSYRRFKAAQHFNNIYTTDMAEIEQIGRG